MQINSALIKNFLNIGFCILIYCIFVMFNFTDANANPSCESPNIMLVLDKSGSMADDNKWYTSKSAISSILSSHSNLLRFGLMLFPWTEYCEVGQVRVAPGDNTSSSIISQMNSTSPGGGTPMAASLWALYNYSGLRDANRRNFVILITDGEDTCTGNADSDPVRAVQDLKTLDIDTFVVGFGSGVVPTVLNNMASAGGTARSSYPYYYQADNPSDLSTALDDIVRIVTTEVCDGKDNDCDGTTDENLVQHCNLGCGDGTQTCQSGNWSDCSAPGPQPESCDGFDNNCNGAIDEGLQQQCSTACGNGTEYCQNANWSGCNAPNVYDETCNNIDDNCNGQTDEGLNRPCSNICGEGEEICSAGSWINCTAQQPVEEICNNYDDDCDGATDEMLYRPCETACGQGEELCLAGNWENCNAPPVLTEECNYIDDDCDGTTDEGVRNACDLCGDLPDEICDGIDNDCDGLTDEGNRLCPGDKSCICGACQERCYRNECTLGTYTCVSGYCLPEEDTCCATDCPGGTTCENGECITLNNCNENCAEGQECRAGNCVELDCFSENGPECNEGEICKAGDCITDPCFNVQCDENQFCRNGVCIDSCHEIVCPEHEICVDGICEAQDCDIRDCNMGQICINGECAQDPCNGMECSDIGYLCDQGECIEDLCIGVQCPENAVCYNGQCYSKELVEDIENTVPDPFDPSNSSNLDNATNNSGSNSETNINTNNISENSNNNSSNLINNSDDNFNNNTSNSDTNNSTSHNNNSNNVVNNHKSDTNNSNNDDEPDNTGISTTSTEGCGCSTLP